MSIVAELKQLINEKFDIDPQTIDENTPMAEYGLDSLALAEFLFTVEDHFKIDFPDSQMQIDTLSGLANVIDELRHGLGNQALIRQAA